MLDAAAENNPALTSRDKSAKLPPAPALTRQELKKAVDLIGRSFRRHLRELVDLD